MPLDVRKDPAAFLYALRTLLSEESSPYVAHALVLNVERQRHHLLLHRCDLSEEPPDVGCPRVAAPDDVNELLKLDLPRAIFVY